MFIIFILWYFFHLFCFGWHYDWHHVRSGISSADYQAYLDEYETNASKGKSKLNIWLSQTVPGVREQHRWCREHAADDHPGGDQQGQQQDDQKDRHDYDDGLFHEIHPFVFFSLYHGGEKK